jgi:broad specificity phosphatase PhoE
MVVNLYIARHAKPEGPYGYNTTVNRIMKLDSELGRAQAAKLGYDLRDEKIDRVITSEFPRAIETADIAATALGIRDRIASEVAGLNEVFHGKQTVENLENWINTGNGVDYSDELKAETVAQVRLRCREFLESLREYDDQTILVVCHGVLASVLQLELAGFEIDTPVAKNPRNIILGHAEYFEASYSFA